MVKALCKSVKTKFSTTPTAEMLSGHSIPPVIPGFDGGDRMPTVRWQARPVLAASSEFY